MYRRFPRRSRQVRLRPARGGRPPWDGAMRGCAAVIAVAERCGRGRSAGWAGRGRACPPPFPASMTSSNAADCGSLYRSVASGPRRGSQVVRQRSAKPPSDGSIPSRASRDRKHLGRSDGRPRAVSHRGRPRAGGPVLLADTLINRRRYLRRRSAPRARDTARAAQRAPSCFPAGRRETRGAPASPSRPNPQRTHWPRRGSCPRRRLGRS
jgi:hypothetical protein